MCEEGTGCEVLGTKTSSRLLRCIGLLLLLLSLNACTHKPDPNTAVMIIESSPTNLDPRIGIDAQSERIGKLLFDALLRRDEHFNAEMRRCQIKHIISGQHVRDPSG